MNINSFIRIYTNLANNIVRDEELTDLYWDLQDRIQNVDNFICKAHNKSHNIKGKFVDKVPDRFSACIAVDAVAHALHQGGNEILQKIFPSAEYSIVKSQLDSLAGNDIKSPVRQYNRDYFTTFFSDDTGIIQLEKQEKQVGRTSKDDISTAIQEYKKLFDAGIASKGEILTLSRFYPDEEKYRIAVIKLGLLENEPMVVGGPASVEMVDREGHLITTEALDDAFRQFMINPRTRNAQVIHSDVQCGWILPAYMAKNGNIYKSGVDDKQLWVVCEIRDDVSIGKKVIEEINKGTLRSYSIAGSGTDIEKVEKNGTIINQVNALNILEISIVERPMNPGAMFDILKGIPQYNIINANQLIEKITNLPITLSGFHVYIEDSEIPKVIIKAEKTNVLIEEIIKKIKEIVGEDVPIVFLSEELFNGEEVPLFRIKLEPIGLDNETNNYVDVSDLTEINIEGEQIMRKTSLEILNEMIQKQKRGKGEYEKESDTPDALNKQMMSTKKAFETRMKRHKQLLKELGFPEGNMEEMSKNVSKEMQDPMLVNEAGDFSIEIPPIEKRPSSARRNSFRSLDAV